MKIDVTQEDIDGAGDFQDDGDPIERAILRLTGNEFDEVYVGRVAVEIDDEAFDLPEGVREFVDAFDEGGPEAVEPISFDLPIDHLVAREDP
jgi:hypothetical protein